MPSFPCEPNELKFGMWGFYHQLTICGGDGLKLKKKVFFEQPYMVQVLCQALFHAVLCLIRKQMLQFSKTIASTAKVAKIYAPSSNATSKNTKNRIFTKLSTFFKLHLTCR